MENCPKKRRKLCFALIFICNNKVLRPKMDFFPIFFFYDAYCVSIFFIHDILFMFKIDIFIYYR